LDAGAAAAAFGLTSSGLSLLAFGGFSDGVSGAFAAFASFEGAFSAFASFSGAFSSAFGAAFGSS
jgi:hypothetical protein